MSRLGEVLRVLRGAAAIERAPTAAGSSGEPPAPVGLVEVFTRRRVVGWVSVPAESPPTRVGLHVGALEVSATYATPDAPMSGFTGEDHDPEDQGDRSDLGDRPVPVGGRPVPGPAGDHRNSRQQIRVFSFRIKGLWPYLRKSTRVTVRVDGRPLPIAGHGMFLTPPRAGRHRVDDLRALLEQGHVLTQTGEIELAKGMDEEWQDRVIRLYDRVRAVLQERHDHRPFLIYGTLLGLVREGGYLAHDADFDAAYLSDRRTGPEAAEELVEIGLSLVDAGLVVDARERLLHVHDPEDPAFRIDLFHVYADDRDCARFPWGVAGGTALPAQDLRDLEETDFPGGRALVPARAEAVVAHLYGEDWRQPKPGWTWDLARTDAALDGLLTDEQRSRVYWADFYARRDEVLPGSTFQAHLAGRDGTPPTVVDLGCGDGRDSCAFGETGRTVLGLDRSPVGVAHARQHAEARGLSDRVRFRICDASHPGELADALREGRAGRDEPVLFYLRFFLHAVPAATQATLLRTIAAEARAGDLFAAEFRTDKDAATAKVHGEHYRRYQSAEAFLAELRELGYEVLEWVESAGLSPYGNEDPVLCRVLAHPAPASGTSHPGAVPRP